MRPHAAGMTGETREMQELRRLPDNLVFKLSEVVNFVATTRRRYRQGKIKSAGAAVSAGWFWAIFESVQVI